jgi:hypothetical protein
VSNSVLYPVTEMPTRGTATKAFNLVAAAITISVVTAFAATGVVSLATSGVPLKEELGGQMLGQGTLKSCDSIQHPSNPQRIFSRVTAALLGDRKAFATAYQCSAKGYTVTQTVPPALNFQ